MQRRNFIKNTLLATGALGLSTASSFALGKNSKSAANVQRSAEKIILDTDIGDDIDDALAIAFALNSKELEVVGVTTVLRDVDKRTKMVKQLLDVMGRNDVPVYKGIGTPLVHKVDLFHVPPQYFPEVEAYDYDRTIDAVDFMADAIRKNPGEITLVPVGPLTNIGVLLIKNPDLKPLIKSINLMGGAYYSFINEYNIEKDPEAAKFVFDSGVPIKAIGLDVTTQCILSKAYFDKFENSNDPFIKYLMKLIEAWRKATRYTYPCLHDPLAVFSVFDTGLLEYEEKFIDVELYGEFTRCMTIPRDRDQQQNKEGYYRKTKPKIAKSIKSKEFVDLFANRVFGI